MHDKFVTLAYEAYNNHAVL